MLRVQILYRSCLFVLILLACTDGAFAQRINTEFGKNRVQYHDDFKYWYEYESENFVMLWYGESRNVAQSTIMLAEYDHEEIINILEYSLRDKIEIVVYLDVSDLHQSNFGLDEELFDNDGETHIIGNRMFVYFDGDHEQMRRRIREGIATVYFNSILFGSSLQDMVQNAISLDLPEWYKEGLIEFVGQPWDFEREVRLREYFESEVDFVDLSVDFPRLAGHSFWYFIAREYGNTAISNIIYLTRIRKDLNSGFDFVLSKQLEELLEEWENFYREDLDIGEDHVINNDQVIYDHRVLKDADIQRIVSSQDGSKLAIITNDLGKTKVLLRNESDGSVKTIWKRGHRAAMIETDRNYPVVDFSPNGKSLLVIYEHRDVIYYRSINIETEELQEGSFPNDIERVYDVDFSDRSRFLMSVSIDGYSELVIFTPTNRQYRRVTSDYHDDLSPVHGELLDKKGYFFSSNRSGYLAERERMDSELPLNHKDIYFLSSEGTELYQITNSPLINETKVEYRDGQLYYLSDKTGVKQVYRIDLKNLYFEENLEVKAKASIACYENSGSSISSENRVSAHQEYIYDYQIANSAMIDLSHSLDRQKIRKYSLSVQDDIASSNYRKIHSSWRLSDYEDNEEFIDLLDRLRSQNVSTEREDKDLKFLTRFEDFPGSKVSNEQENEVALTNRNYNLPYRPVVRRIHDFRPVRAVAYRLRFGIKDVTTTINNELLFGGLNTFAGTSEEFEPPRAGFLIKGEAEDVFEDYKLIGGARFPTDFNGSEYFVSLSDRSKLIDKTYSLYRRGRSYDTTVDFVSPSREQETNFIGTAEYRYPLDFFNSIRATGTFRTDKITPLSLDASSLPLSPTTAQRLGLRLEYVFDNSLRIDFNQLRGSRAKFYVEAVKRFDLGLSRGSSFSLSEGFMTNIGLDARHYEGFLRHSVFALRAAGGTSFGTEKILFHAGGVENWLFNSFDNTIPIPADDRFAYRTIVSNIRGFQYNVRNGNSFAILNAEARFPIFKYLSRRQLRSSFLRSFQVIGFFDTGSAWKGLNPFDEDNPLNTIMVNTQDIVQVEARYFRQPFVYGYGFGARALLFGYHIKLDYGWGVDSGIRNDGRLYISLGTDF